MNHPHPPKFMAVVQTTHADNVNFSLDEFLRTSPLNLQYYPNTMEVSGISFVVFKASRQTLLSSNVQKQSPWYL